MGRLAGLLARGRRHDEGTSLIEVAVGLGVMSIAVIAVIGSMGSGMELVGHSRQRSTGTSVAAEKLERMRNLPFNEVALLDGDGTHPVPVYNGDPQHPNNRVSVDGSGYRIGDSPSPSSYETLVKDASGGLWHEEDPLDVSGTEFRVLQYVTWVEEPSIKRVIVVVLWKFPVRSGNEHTVVQSTYVTDGTVTVAPPTPTPTGSPETEPTAPPSAPPPSSPPNCNGNNPPEGGLVLLSGSGAEVGFTNSTSVQVQMTAGDDDCLDVLAELSNDGTNWVPVVLMCTKQCTNEPPRTGMGVVSPTTASWTITPGDGNKTVHLRFVDGNETISPTYSESITLDQTVPSTPGAFAVTTCSMSGTERTIGFTWTSSSDTNFRGHRLYRSVDSGSWVPISTVAANSVSDTASKSYNSVRYHVVGYDDAGNESDETGILTFSKNKCP